MLTVTKFIINKKYLILLKDGSEYVVICTATNRRQDTFECCPLLYTKKCFNTRVDNNILDIVELQPAYKTIDQLFYY